MVQEPLTSDHTVLSVCHFLLMRLPPLPYDSSAQILLMINEKYFLDAYRLLVNWSQFKPLCCFGQARCRRQNNLQRSPTGISIHLNYLWSYWPRGHVQETAYHSLTVFCRSTWRGRCSLKGLKKSLSHFRRFWGVRWEDPVLFECIHYINIGCLAGI